MSAPQVPGDDEIRYVMDGFGRVTKNIGSFIRGKPRVIDLTVVCLLAQGHLLIDDVPGTGKTSLAKALSCTVDASVRRVQFTPDLLPTDLTGVMIYDQNSRQFEFHEGPVFANIVLADEINRASPKTQSALLEVMEEGQVTIDGRQNAVPQPFFVMATQNPVELAGTFALPEAQTDRFMMKMAVGYPDRDAEAEVVEERTRRRTPSDLRPVITVADLESMIEICTRVHLAPAVVDYIVAVVRATRGLEEVSLGASPRASVALATAAQALAATRNRNYVTPDDVKYLAPVVLSHRLVMRPEAELDGRTSDQLVAGILDAVPISADLSRR